MIKHVQHFLLVYFLFLITSGYAQQKQIDSIEQVLSLVNNSIAREATLDSLISDDLRYMNGEVRWHFIEKAINQSTKTQNDKRLSKIYTEKSRWFDSKMISDSSLYYGEKSLRLAAKTKDSLVIINAWRNLANAHSYNGEYTKSLKYYNLILAYSERNGLANKREMLLTQFNLAGLYYEIDEMEKCIDLYKYLYHHPLVIEDTNWRNETGLNYAIALFVAEKYEPMLELTERLEKSETRPGFLAHIYGMHSGANLGLQNFKEAIRYNEMATRQFEKMGDSLAAFSNTLMAGDIRVDMGQYDVAEQIFMDSYNKLMAMPDPPVVYVENVYGALSRVYRGKKDYKKVVDYTDKLYTFRDSIKGIEKQNAISELEIQYETEKVKREKDVAEKQVIISQLESNKNRSLLIGTLVILGLVAVSSLLFFGRQKAKKKADMVTLELRETQKRLALEKQYRDSELKALKAQMNPHFIFNALNSIQEYIILNKKNLAGDYLGKFADLMRKYLHHSDAGTLTIQDEIESLEMYLDLEALRFEDTLAYSFNVSENINKEYLRIPTMLIQPYVENALKHGLLHRRIDRKLSITFTKENDKTISCIVEDNGVGRKRAAEIKEQTKNMHASFATKATENRLNLLNYEKERKIGVEIIDLLEEDGSAKGTQVVLTIPTTTN